MQFNPQRALAVFMTILLAVSMVGMGFVGGAAAATVTAEGDLAGDGTDELIDFAAADSENHTVTYETTATSDTTDDFEELSLTLEYENTTYAEYDIGDAVVISGDSDDTTVLEFEFTVDHSDLETLPGDAEQITTVDYTITEQEVGADEVTESFAVDYEFDSSHAVRTIHSDDDDLVADFEAADDDGGMFSLSSFNIFNSDLDTSADIEDDIGVNGTETDIHFHVLDDDLVDTYDESVDGLDEGDRVGLLMTSTLNGEAMLVFNEEAGETIWGDEVDEDEDTYAVYHGDGHVEINTGDDRVDEDDEEVSANMVSGIDVGSGTLQDDFGYDWFEANGLTFGSLSDSFFGTLSDIGDYIPGL